MTINLRDMFHDRHTTQPWVMNVSSGTLDTGFNVSTSKHSDLLNAYVRMKCQLDSRHCRLDIVRVAKSPKGYSPYDRFLFNILSMIANGSKGASGIRIETVVSRYS